MLLTNNENEKKGKNIHHKKKKRFLPVIGAIAAPIISSIISKIL